MNAAWHKRNAMPRSASVDQRIAWHREHQKKCACRPIPASLVKIMAGPPRRPRSPAIDAYLAAASPPNRALLRQLRQTIHAILPDAEECISYRLPAFRLRGKVVAGFSATAQGCSYYPFSGTTLGALASDLRGRSQTKSALHFDADRPLPVSLVRKLLAARRAEIDRAARSPGRPAS